MMDPMEVIVVVDVDAIGAAVDEFVGEVSGILALFPLKAPGVDFSAELDQIRAARERLDAALEAASALAEAPAEDEPVEDPAPVGSSAIEGLGVGILPPAEVLPADPAPAQDPAAADPSAV